MRRRVAIPCLAALVATAISATPAAAARAPAKMTSTAVSGCGSQNLAVRAPADASGTITPADVGAGFPAADPLLARAARQHLQWQRTMSCRALPGVKPVVKTDTIRPLDSTSENWSGYESPESARYAGMSWTVPTAGEPDGTQETYSSIWPGLGTGSDGTTDELIQAGTEQRATCIVLRNACEFTGDLSFFWFEVFPDQSEQQITSFVPSPGDHVGVDVYYSSADRQALFFLCDFTSGGADGTGGCLEAVESSVDSPGPSAEWIVERTRVNGEYPPLADYGSVDLTDASFVPVGGTYSSIQSGGGYPITMQAGSDILSTVGPLGLDAAGDSFFTATWHAYT